VHRLMPSVRFASSRTPICFSSMRACETPPPARASSVRKSTRFSVRREVRVSFSLIPPPFRVGDLHDERIGLHALHRLCAASSPLPRNAPVSAASSFDRSRFHWRARALSRRRGRVRHLWASSLCPLRLRKVYVPEVLTLVDVDDDGRRTRRQVIGSPQRRNPLAVSP
jgi:hypothetical protein